MGQLVTVTVTGTYKDASGALLKGKTLLFTPVSVFGDNGITVPNTAVRVVTNSTTATFSVALLTSDLDGAYVRYSVLFHNQTVKKFDLTDDLASTTLEDLLNAFDGAQAPSAAVTLADHEARIDALEATPPGGGTPIRITAGLSSGTYTSLGFLDSNGISFGLSGTAMTASHNGLTNSGLFRATANDSQLRFTSQDSQLRFTSGDTQLQFTSGMSNYLGTGATQSFRHTSADTQLQFTSANSNFLGTAATQSFRHTSADSQLRFTSADSQLRFTNADTQLQFTSANTKFAQEWALTGNTSGTTSSVQGSRLYFSGGNNVTLSGNSNTIVVSAGSQAPSPINFSAGTTSGNLGSVVFSNSNGVGFGLNGSTITASYTVPTQSNQTLGGYALGNTTLSSSATFDARSHSFSAGGGVSVGVSNGSVVISGPQTVAQTNQTVGAYAVGNTTQSSSGTFDARTISFQGTGGVSVGVSNGSVVISGNTGGGAALSVSAGTLTGTRASLVFSDANAVSFGMSGSTITASIPGATSLSATGAVSISANGSTISIGAPVQTNQNNSLYALGNTTQNSSSVLNASVLSLNALGGMTVGYSNGSIQLSAPQTVAQTNQTLGFYALGNTTQSSSGTFDARTMSVTAGGNVSAGFTNGSLAISGPASSIFRYTSADSQLRFTSADSQLRFTSADTQLQFTSANTKFAQEWQLTGNTSGTTSSVQGSRWYFSGGANMTISGSSNSLVFSAGSAAPSPVNFSAGTTSGNLGSVVFSNSNLVSFGINGSTITGSVPGTSSLSATGAVSISVNASTISIGAPTQTNQTMGFYATSNTVQSSSGTQDARSVTYQARGDVSVGVSNGSVVVSGGANLQYFELDDVQGMGLMTHVSALNTKPIFVPFILKGNLTNSSMFIQMSQSSAGSNAFTVQAALYTYVNATSIARLGSLQNVFSNASTASISGPRYFVMSGWEANATALTPGAYVMGLNFSAGATASMNYSIFGGQTVSAPLGFVSAGTDQNATAPGTVGVVNMWGRYTANSAALPANVVQTDLLANYTGASQPLAPWFILRS